MSDIEKDIREFRGKFDGYRLAFLYTNWRGETSMREVTPIRIFRGSNFWYPDPQWLMEAFDWAKNERREFAMKDMRLEGDVATLVQNYMNAVVAGNNPRNDEPYRTIGVYLRRILTKQWEMRAQLDAMTNILSERESDLREARERIQELEAMAGGRDSGWKARATVAEAALTEVELRNEELCTEIARLRDAVSELTTPPTDREPTRVDASNELIVEEAPTT